MKRQIIKTIDTRQKNELCINLLELLSELSLSLECKLNIDVIKEVEPDLDVLKEVKSALDFLLRHGKGPTLLKTRTLLLSLYLKIISLDITNEIKIEDVLNSLKVDDKTEFWKNVIQLSDTILQDKTLQESENTTFKNRIRLLIFLSRGAAKQYMDLMDDAIKDYLKAISFDPYCSGPHFFLSNAYSQIHGKADESAKHKRIAEVLERITSSSNESLSEGDKAFINNYLEENRPVLEI